MLPISSQFWKVCPPSTFVCRNNLCSPAGVWICVGRSSHGQSTRWGTGPCWLWCCGGRKQDPPPQDSLWDPAWRSVPGIWSTHKAACLIWAHWEIEKPSEHSSSWSELLNIAFSAPPYLRAAWVKQRFRSVWTYLRHCCVAQGLDSTVNTDTAFSSSSSITFFSAFSSSLTKYTPDSSLPWVPPHTATRGNLGKHTTLSASIWLRAEVEWKKVQEGVWKGKKIEVLLYNRTLYIQFLAAHAESEVLCSYTTRISFYSVMKAASLSGTYQLQCWCYTVHHRQHCNTKQRHWFVKPYLVYFFFFSGLLKPVKGQFQTLEMYCSLKQHWDYKSV